MLTAACLGTPTPPEGRRISTQTYRQSIRLGITNLKWQVQVEAHQRLYLQPDDCTPHCAVLRLRGVGKVHVSTRTDRALAGQPAIARIRALSQS
jgi:hypothetical protein